MAILQVHHCIGRIAHRHVAPSTLLATSHFPSHRISCRGEETWAGVTLLPARTCACHYNTNSVCPCKCKITSTETLVKPFRGPWRSTTGRQQPKISLREMITDDNEQESDSEYQKQNKGSPHYDSVTVTKTNDHRRKKRYYECVSLSMCAMKDKLISEKPNKNCTDIKHCLSQQYAYDRTEFHPNERNR
ncbi:hypothetical protein PR048_015901 [Dryococelus australis]|uniref:Uncharacterized protein n=1 Tax=Dryococelus australis TaxID=614101 RepID=A0ABQ9HIA4_9NEOP|nr:hypothetical protein PR048_015901 [Dryococelus australis]